MRQDRGPPSPEEDVDMLSIIMLQIDKLEQQQKGVDWRVAETLQTKIDQLYLKL